jgi:1,2-diacylglycerol 3-alpha-glucosyltransferase
MIENKLKILMIATDRNVLVEGSAVSERMKDYGALVEEMHIVLLSDHSHGLKEAQIAKNVWVYPTNSSFTLLRPLDAAQIGKKLVYERHFVRGQSVIVAQDPFECGWAGMKVQKKWHLPLEVQLHTDPFSPYFSGFQNQVRKFYAHKILRSAERVRCVSRAVAEKLSGSVDREKIFVLPIFVDKEKVMSGQVSFDLHARFSWHFILLAVARLTSEKNLGMALEVLADVRKQFPDTGLVVVGTGPEESHLKALVKKLNLEGTVEFAGWQNDLTSFYKTANLFIQTSLFEGYGLALVEAGLNGLPVVTTPVGIVEELENGKDAYICSVGDVETFSKAICDLIGNNFKRENLRLNLKNTLENKLISKEEYLERLSEKWRNTAKLVR